MKRIWLIKYFKSQYFEDLKNPWNNLGHLSKNLKSCKTQYKYSKCKRRVNSSFAPTCWHLQVRSGFTPQSWNSKQLLTFPLLKSNHNRNLLNSCTRKDCLCERFFGFVFFKANIWSEVRIHSLNFQCNFQIKLLQRLVSVALSSWEKSHAYSPKIFLDETHCDES